MKKYYVKQEGIINREFDTDLPLKELFKQAVSYGRYAYRLNATVRFSVYDYDRFELVFRMYTVKSLMYDVCRLVRFNACGVKYGDLTIRCHRSI